MKNKKRTYLLLGILIVEVIIIWHYNKSYSNYYGNMINVFFLFQLLLVLSIIIFFIRNQFSTRFLLTNIVISVLALFFILSNFGIIYYNSSKYSEYNIRNILGYENEFTPWKYYNLLDEGYNSKVENIENYTFDDGKEYISKDVIALYKDYEKNFCKCQYSFVKKVSLIFVSFINKFIFDSI